MAQQRNGQWRICTIDNCPSSPGVYSIYGDDRLLYIGQSRNIYHRIQDHFIHRTSIGFQTKWGIFKSVAVKVRTSFKRQDDWLRLESALIRRTQPPHNILGIQRKRVTVDPDLGEFRDEWTAKHIIMSMLDFKGGEVATRRAVVAISACGISNGENEVRRLIRNGILQQKNEMLSLVKSPEAIATKMRAAYHDMLTYAARFELDIEQVEQLIKNSRVRSEVRSVLQRNGFLMSPSKSDSASSSQASLF